MNQRRKHVYVPLYWLGALSAAVGLQSTAFGQAEQGAELEEIVVTGSYLFTGLDSPSPVQVITGDELVSTAPTDLATYFFDNVTQSVSTQPIGQTANAGMARDRAIRTANVDLRGIGAENTLVLLNGRRTIENAAPAFSGFRVVDINSLVPRIAIARTELLLDGGSALYGSDAVAGVINTVTRNDFDGFDFSVDSRFFEEELSAKDVTLAAIWGAGNARSHVIAAIEWHETDRLELDIASDDFESDPNVDPFSGTGLVDQGFLDFSNGAGGPFAVTWIDPDCGNPAFGAPVLAYYPAYQDPGDDQVYEVGAGPSPLLAADQCAEPQGFNTNQIIQNDVEQLMAFVAGEHHFSDRLTAKVELNFNRQRFTDTENWGDNSGASWVPLTPAALGFAIPVTAPAVVRTQSLDPTFGFDAGGAALPIYSPGETLPFLGELDASQESDIWRAAFTLEGEINNDWSWRFDTSAAYNTVRNSIRDMITTRYGDAIVGLGGPSCDAATGTPGVDDCFYYNPFMSSALPDAASLQTGLSQTGLANDPTMLDWLVPLRTDVFDAEFYSAEVQVTGTFGDLPGGPIGLAVGAAFRSDYVARDSDQLGNSGETATLGVVTDYAGRQTVDSLYAELALPISDTVNVQLAARYEDYDGFSAVSPKIAALWTPTDNLILRASFSQSFKAPGVIHLASTSIFNGAASRSITIDSMTYGVTGMGPIRGAFQISANPDLQEQTSDNWSVGFDYDITDNISFGAAYVGIDFTDRIINPNMPDIVSRDTCFLTDAMGIPIVDVASGDLTYNADPTDPNQCVILIDPTAPSTFSNVALLFAEPVNQGFLNVEALDLRASMFWDTPIGMVSFTPNVSIFTKYEYPGDAEFQCPGGVCDGVGRTTPRGSSGITDIPRWQGTFNSGLRFGDQNVRLTARYTDSVNAEFGDLSDEDKATFQHVEGLWTLDVNWSWQFSAASSVSASVRNLFAEEPPATGGALFNRNRRTFSLQYQHSFAN